MSPKAIRPVLPREANPVRVRSQYRRSVRLMRKGVADAKANPNAGTVSRRRERTLAAWSVSRKLRVIVLSLPGGTKLRGAAKIGALRRAARAYYHALATWRGYYNGGHAL